MSSPTNVEEAVSKSRSDIAASFEATTALLSSLEVDGANSDTMKSKMDSMRSNIDGLMEGLVRDEQSLFTSLAESFSKGQLTSEMLQNMINAETGRTSFMLKMTGAMKVQLEQVFGVVEKISENVAEEGRNNELNKDINNMYLDFADLASTVDNMAMVVKAPGKALERTIGELKYDVENVLATSPVAVRRASVALGGTGMNNGRKLRVLKRNDDPIAGAGSSANVSVASREDGAVEQSDEAREGTADPADTADSVGLQSPIRIKAVVERSVQTLENGPEGTSDSGLRAVSVDGPTGVISRAVSAASAKRETPDNATPMASTGTSSATLVISGSRPTLESRDITKTRMALIEKERELASLESKLTEHQFLLNARADELRTVAHKLVMREMNLQAKMSDLEDVINQRVSLKIDAAVSEALAQKQGEMLETSSAAEMSETREFLESAVNVSRSMHDGDAEESLPDQTSPSSMAGGDEDGTDQRPLQVRGLSSSPGSPFESTPVSPVTSSANRKKPVSTGSDAPALHSRINSAASDAAERGHTPIVPLDSPAPLTQESSAPEYKSVTDLPQAVLQEMKALQSVSPEPKDGGSTSIQTGNMIVIFPPKQRDAATDTKDLLSLKEKSGSIMRLSGAPIKTVITSRKVGHEVQTMTKTKGDITDDVVDADLGSPVRVDAGNNAAKQGGIFPASGEISGLQSNRQAVSPEKAAIAATKAEMSKAIKTGQLPLVGDDQAYPGILQTRTYRDVPPRDFRGILRESQNPLLELLHEYADCIDEVYHAPLCSAASTSLAVHSATSGDVIEAMFKSTIASLEKLDASCLVLLQNIAHCEELANNMIIVKGAGDISDHHYMRSLTELYHYFGEIESLKLWVDVQLTEYRNIFERVEALGIVNLPALANSSTPAHQAHQSAFRTFSSCAGRTSEAASRFDSLKLRCQKYDIARGHDPIKLAGRGLAEAHGVNLEEFLNLKDEVGQLRSLLREAEDETEELNLEVFRVMQEKDRTPGALMFFSILQDPVTVSVLQQMNLQLGKLKPFSDGDEHLDFTALRKRLQVCISCVPTVERFVQRYLSLHKKWSVNRLGSFVNRGQVGGPSDSANLCPLCNNDANLNLASHAPGFPITQTSLSSGTGTTGQPTKRRGLGMLRQEHNSRIKKHIKVKEVKLLKDRSNATMTDSIVSEGSAALPSINVSIPRV